MSQKFEEYFYLFSNGGKDYYPDNTLTNFVNYFPVPLELSKKYEVGIQALGFSSLFKNVTAPPAGVPSLIITNCNNSNSYIDGIGVKTKTNEHSGVPVSGHATRHIERMIRESETFGIATAPIKWNFRENEVQSCIQVDPEVYGKTTLCKQQNCFYKYFYLDNREYNARDIHRMCETISTTKVDCTYVNNRIEFKLGTKWDLAYGFHPCFIMMHETFISSFNLEFLPMYSYQAYSKSQNFTDIIQIGRLGASTMRHFQWSANYQGHKYYVYMIDNLPPPTPVQSYTGLTGIVSNTIDIKKPQFPKTIKVVCENIAEQIYNSSYSQNMLVYTPDFKKLKNYTTQEIESVDYMQLLNTSLKEMRIKLTDEDGNLLHLLPGPATWIKMALRSVPLEKKSFNVVLTSQPSADYKNNVSSNFRVKLPSPLSLNGNWKVCVNSISHPTNISTFLNAEGDFETEKFKTERSIGFQEWIDGAPADGVEPQEFALEDNHSYDEEELIGVINKFFQGFEFGSCEITDGIVTLSSMENKAGVIYIGYTLAKILGFHGEWDDDLTTTKGAHIVKIVMASTGMGYRFQNRIDLSYTKPRYIMIYVDIIKPILVAGDYRKLIRISPIEESDLDYVTKYFRHKEFCDLENTLIESINVVLASHDGRQIYFSSNQDVIVNLEFSNHSD